MANRHKFRKWAKDKGIDLKRSDVESAAFRVWLHCELEKESKQLARKEILSDIIKELEAMYE